ncbi:hypothetical protein VTO73DRAFT_1918 [Trametes versicolor]
MAAPSPWGGPPASTQHATDRFPRFTYLLRAGTPKPEADGGLVRRSADPGEYQASLATIPDPLAQRGTGDETCLRSCVASSSATTCGPCSRDGSSPSRASTPTTPAGTLASVSKSPSTPASASKPLFDPAPYTMANNNSATTSRGGASTPRLPVPTRRGTDAIAGERIMPGTPLSTSPTSQTSSDFGDGGADGDDLEQDDAQGTNQNAEGQPRKKKTRRAGVAITRVRRMQREVRRLAEEEEQVGLSTQQRQQPHQRVRPFLAIFPDRGSTHLISPFPVSFVERPDPPEPAPLRERAAATLAPRPAVRPWPATAVPAAVALTGEPVHAVRDTPYSGGGWPPRAQRAVYGCALTCIRIRPHTGGACRAARSSFFTSSRLNCADRVCGRARAQDGDDVVVWRPSGPMASSNIWAYRPDERPRGGTA